MDAAGHRIHRVHRVPRGADGDRGRQILPNRFRLGHLEQLRGRTGPAGVRHVGAQLAQGVRRLRAGGRATRVPARLHGELHERAVRPQEGDHPAHAGADAAADHHLRLRNHLLVRQAGPDHPAARLPAIRHLRVQRPADRLRGLHAADLLPADPQQLPVRGQKVHHRLAHHGRQAGHDVPEHRAAPAGRHDGRRVHPVVLPRVHRLRHPHVGGRRVRRARDDAVQPDARLNPKLQSWRGDRRVHAHPLDHLDHPDDSARALLDPLHEDLAGRAAEGSPPRLAVRTGFRGGAGVRAEPVRRDPPN